MSSHLYRIRILFTPEGDLELIETVHRHDMVARGEPGETVCSLSTEPLRATIGKLMKELAAVAASDAAKAKADAEKLETGLQKQQAEEAERAKNEKIAAQRRVDAVNERVSSHPKPK